MTITAKPEATAGIEDRLYTAEEILRFPSDWHYELIEGRLQEMPPTSDDHGYSTIDLSGEIWAFVRANEQGRCFAAETGFLLEKDPDTVLAPDFAFVAKDRMDYLRTGPNFPPLAPDLVVETRSPSDRLTTMRNKMARWLSFGVRMALLLDPVKRTITVYRPGADPGTLSAADTLSGGDVLPGFELPLRRLFAG